MSLRTIALSRIFEDIVKSLIVAGTNPRLSDILAELDARLEGKSLASPDLVKDLYTVTENEISSAAKWNLTKQTLHKDLSVLYESLFEISDRSLANINRWKDEIANLEKRIDSLTDRVSAVLLSTESVDSFVFAVEDKLNDLSHADLDWTDILLDTSKGIVTIPQSGTSPARIYVDTLSDNDVSFSILSTAHLLGSSNVDSSKPVNALLQKDVSWRTHTYMDRTGPVTGQLSIKLPSKKTLSRIAISLHHAGSASPITLVPMTSTDGINFAQLSTTNFARRATTKAVFSFDPTEATDLRIIMIKDAPDDQVGSNYRYEFGAKSIELFNDGYTSDTTYTFISTDYDITDIIPDKSTVLINKSGFTKLQLITCDDVPAGTSIDYSIAVSTDGEPVDPADTVWMPIDPINRTIKTKPTQLDLASLAEQEIGDLTVSYSATSNPGASAYIVNTNLPLPAIRTDLDSTRYKFLNSEDRILNLQIDRDQIEYEGLRVFRNVGATGSTNHIRGNPRGWGFEDPFYKTTVKIKSRDGLALKVGAEPIILDGEPKRGSVVIPYGVHQIWIHKSNWINVTGGATTLTELKALDRFYPFNHRLLIEGYDYDAAYPDTDETVYTGVDLFAELAMQEISPIDFVSILDRTDLTKFARDLDTGVSYPASGQPEADFMPTTVFLVKVNPEYADFANEVFQIEYELIEVPFTNFRFRADLKTTSTTSTPVLDSYKIKLI